MRLTNVFSRKRWRNAVVLPLIAGFICTGALAANAVDSDNTAESLALWAVPPLKTNTPQTEEEKEEGQQHGRTLPEPELLQPRLDPALSNYRPLSNKNALSGNYKCGSSDVLVDLAKRWTAEFQQYYPKVNFSLEAPYAGSLGTLELIDGKLDCVFVSRELKPSDIEGFRNAYGYDPTSIPISGGSYRHYGFLDSMSFITHKDNPIEKLSFDQLDSILSTTRHRGGEAVTTWGQLGLTGKWADKPIRIYGIKPWNGFEEFVRQRVLNADGKRGEWRSPENDPNVHWDEKVFDVASNVAKDPYAIGFTGNAYVDSPVKMISLSEHPGDPAYAPTHENVAAATYPLSRLTYFNLNRDPNKPMNPVLQEFLKFVLSKQGQQHVTNQGVFLPLRGFQADASRGMLN
ncbi:PstS family phosphate ABC transporter substrate-binding protein [Streptomyces acidicola]|uniref:PstS family phosphate ABC transporter substrate-binding protein n=1 Tax=Streptomyces acidicola TaxID=2596892 RepID=UPI00342A3832